MSTSPWGHTVRFLINPPVMTHVLTIKGGMGSLTDQMFVEGRERLVTVVDFPCAKGISLTRHWHPVTRQIWDNNVIAHVCNINMCHLRDLINSAVSSCSSYCVWWHVYFVESAYMQTRTHGMVQYTRWQAWRARLIKLSHYYCNLIGSHNILRLHTESWLQSPDVHSPPRTSGLRDLGRGGEGGG